MVSGEEGKGEYTWAVDRSAGRPARECLNFAIFSGQSEALHVSHDMVNLPKKEHKIKKKNNLFKLLSF